MRNQQAPHTTLRAYPNLVRKLKLDDSEIALFLYDPLLNFTFEQTIKEYMNFSNNPRILEVALIFLSIKLNKTYSHTIITSHQFCRYMVILRISSKATGETLRATNDNKSMIPRVKVLLLYPKIDLLVHLTKP